MKGEGGAVCGIKGEDRAEELKHLLSLYTNRYVNKIKHKRVFLWRVFAGYSPRTYEPRALVPGGLS